MKSLSSPLTGLAILVALAGSAAASVVYPSVGLSRSFNGTATAWNLFFALEAYDIETELSVESPDGSFTADTSGSTSVNVASLAEVIERAEDDSWRLRVGPQDEADEFDFSVGFSGIGEEAFGAVMVTLPSDLSAVPLGSSVSWSGPEGYDSIYFAVLTPGYGTIFTTFLAGDVTSRALPELAPGDYRIIINYRREVQDGEVVMISDLNDTPVWDEEPLTWLPDEVPSMLYSEANLLFTVIPEPSTALLGLAGGLLCLRRRR